MPSTKRTIGLYPIHLHVFSTKYKALHTSKYSTKQNNFHVTLDTCWVTLESYTYTEKYISPVNDTAMTYLICIRKGVAFHRHCSVIRKYSENREVIFVEFIIRRPRKYFIAVHTLPLQFRSILQSRWI